MKVIWIEYAEVERSILHDSEDAGLGIRIVVTNKEYTKLVAMNKVSNQLQQWLEQLWDERYRRYEEVTK